MTDAEAFGPEQALFPELPAGAFAKQDPGDDLAFYAPPRLVTHIDEAATAALTRALGLGFELIFRHYVPSGARSLKRTCAL